MRTILFAVVLLAACSRAPRRPLDELAAAMPANALALAGVDVDRLRNTPLFANLPEAMRGASYALLAWDGRDLVTATRAAADNRISIAGPRGAGAPPDLLERAPDAPLWVVARGSAVLPLSGNLANINRLLGQTEIAVIALRVPGPVEIQAEAVCRTSDAAQHLEENLRAIGTLLKFPMQLDREGAAVRARASMPAESLGKLF